MKRLIALIGLVIVVSGCLPNATPPLANLIVKDSQGNYYIIKSGDAYNNYRISPVSNISFTIDK